MQAPQDIFVGVDISKAQLDVAVFGQKRLAHFPQTQGERI